MKREWIVDDTDPNTGELSREAVAASLAGEVETIGHRVGGVFVIAPMRVQGPDGFQTVAWAFKYDSHAPAGTVMEALDAAKPESPNGAPVEEPVAAE